MNEYWVCQHCKSLNRLGTGRCYSCKHPYGSEPKTPPVTRANPAAAAAPGPSAPGSVRLPGAPPSGFYSGPSVGAGMVGPGGVPIELGPDTELPSYLSRPTAGPQATSTTFLNPAEPQQSRRSGPLGWLSGRIASSIGSRQSVPVLFVGYASAIMLALLVVCGALLLANLVPVIRHAVQTGSPTGAWGQLDSGSLTTLRLLGVALAGVVALTLLFFSLFVGISTHNALGLGAGTPLLTPGRATGCWLRVLWAQLKLTVGLLAPVALFVAGYAILALVAALVAVELAQRSLDDPFGWLTKPARHLPDLLARMGIDGTANTLLGTAWKGAFLAANLLAILACALPLVAVTARAVAEAAGRPALVNWHGAGLGPVQIAFLAVIMPLLITAAASLALLVPLCIDLVERQKTRRTLSRVGRSRSWLEPPGNYGGAANSPGPVRQEVYDRGAEADGLDEPLYTDSGLDDRGFVDPRLDESLYEDRGWDPRTDQASLNSPSTTSSSPWDDGPSGFPSE